MEALLRPVILFLANAAWQMSLLLVIAYLCSRQLERIQARLEYLFWCGTLCIACFLPMSNLLWARLKSYCVVPDFVGPDLNAGSMTALRSAPASHSALSLRWVGAESLFSAQGALVYLLAGTYLLFVLWRCICLARSWRRTRWLLSSGRALMRRTAEIAEGCRVAMQVKPVMFMSSPLASSVFAAGVFRPVIVLPESLLRSMSSDELGSALRHELAHIRRRDYFWNLAWEIFALPFSFHPCVWWIKRRIARAREMACDELAAGSPDSRSHYAHNLVHLARLMNANATGPSPALGIFDGNHLEERVMQLLEKRPHI